MGVSRTSLPALPTNPPTDQVTHITAHIPDKRTPRHSLLPPPLRLLRPCCTRWQPSMLWA
jgi:hypothetical protein